MTTPKKIASTITNDVISITLDGRYRVFPRASAQAKKLEEALRKVPQDIDEIRLIADVAAYVAAQSFGRVILDDRDRLRLDGHVIDYVAAGTFKRVLSEGFDIEPLTKFIEKVHLNPDKSIAADLYAFLEKGRLPLTPDGNFHAFKRVRADFFDHHSGTVEYKIGSTVEMDRDKCDPNRNALCSRGLHACSFDYLLQFHNGVGKIIIVEINPSDVTAIPTDYNQAKLRCCKMEVLAEIPEADAKNYFSAAVERRFADEKAAAPVEDPEDATDATAADGVTVTASAPEAATTAEVSVSFDDVETNWDKAGEEAGRKAGAADAENGWEYDASFDMPGELSDGPDSARQAYSEGYVRGYGEAFAAGKADAEQTDPGPEAEDEETAESTDPVLDENGFPTEDAVLGESIARTWGEQDAHKAIAEAMAETDEDALADAIVDILDGFEGERYNDVTESPLDSEAAMSNAYIAAFDAVVEAQYAAWAKLVGDIDGRADAQQARLDGVFDLDASNGVHYEAFEDLTDEAGVVHEAAYREAYAKAYVAAHSA
ncbi:RIIB protector from prophage-induced early lysis [Caulobacter phage phiCbK]|uniref:RIIB protector from prophage-induced early lysis n=5 Tax=Viruses TaxID=10239 RepID=K4JP23_9CAUD|nr:RIIB lysis inhibitor [Caulobacter phage phiCbK]AFO71698.1 RIIB protector from prophage-induced early lysis [Caulobacter phage phiCbK]AFU86969.1 putative rIIb-like protein [Caulobacter phage phiCbK]ARB15051.1 lysis inhibitor [Caulobacter phage Ccr32]ARB15384.1 lysis inhibitor [Caulobacter phage Ccr34]